jgi:hypothetical protein
VNIAALHSRDSRPVIEIAYVAFHRRWPRFSVVCSISLALSEQLVAVLDEAIAVVAFVTEHELIDEEHEMQILFDRVIESENNPRARVRAIAFDGDVSISVIVASAVPVDESALSLPWLRAVDFTKALRETILVAGMMAEATGRLQPANAQTEPSQTLMVDDPAAALDVIAGRLDSRLIATQTVIAPADIGGAVTVTALQSHDAWTGVIVVRATTQEDKTRVLLVSFDAVGSVSAGILRVLDEAQAADSTCDGVHATGRAYELNDEVYDVQIASRGGRSTLLIASPPAGVEMPREIAGEVAGALLTMGRVLANSIVADVQAWNRHQPFMPNIES